MVMFVQIFANFGECDTSHRNQQGPFTDHHLQIMSGLVVVFPQLGLLPKQISDLDTDKHCHSVCQIAKYMMNRNIIKMT